MTDSAIETATPLKLRGMWIHDVDDPAGTLKVFKYTVPEGRGSSVDIEAVSHHFSGRQYPVMYVSPFEDFIYSASFDIMRNDPYFPGMGTIEDIRKFARLRSPVCVRDGRGLVVIGVMQGYQENQNSHGFSVSFSVSQLDREEVTL